MQHQDTDKETATVSHSQQEEPVSLPTNGSAAEERMRAAQRDQGKAPTRKGEEKKRD